VNNQQELSKNCVDHILMSSVRTCCNDGVNAHLLAMTLSTSFVAFST